ncbi:LOW QUALITY PROTEIN: E3 ubiquitin-protein ligase RAD18 [Anomaloglossus baeobatrachus]
MATLSTDGAPRGQPRGPVQDLDDLLHCGICFDYFNIAMIIPQCSHNYCSLCIRKFLSYKTQCPTCCVAVTEPELRNNRLLDDLVKTFISARESLSQSLKNLPPQSPKNPSTAKRATRGAQGCLGKEIKQEDKSMDKFLVKTNANISRRSSRESAEDASDVNMSSPSSSTTSVQQKPGVMDSSEEAFVPSTPSTSTVKVKVECPVCGVGILEQYINSHLDGCLTRDEKKESLRSSVQKRKPMAKVVYNLLSDRDLRKRLKDIGLSTQGTKQQMIRRHQEFLHMYNAQCDSLHPKSAAEIVSEIEKNEKICSALGAKRQSVMTFSKDQSEEQIDQIHQDYRKKHESEFQQLIEQVKGRWKTSKGKKVKEEPMGSDGADKIKEEIMVEVMEESTPNHHTVPETEDYCPLKSEKLSVFRSSSPVFPLSPESRASSSSDILRDIEEAMDPGASNSSLCKEECSHSLSASSGIEDMG